MNTTSLGAWIIDHDNQKLFVIFYIGLAVVLSIWVSLFWLVAVVAVHLLFELVRQHTLHARRREVLAEALWEVKLDLALIFFALALSLYMDILLGAVSLGLGARLAALSRTGRFARLFQAGARAGTRFAGWQRLIRGFLLSMDDLAQVARALGRRGKRPEAALAGAESAGTEGSTQVDAGGPQDVTSGSIWGSWAQPWSRGDWFVVLFLAACLLSIFAAPALTQQPWEAAMSTLKAELAPFPAR
jgi:hypothetical protein